MLTEIGFGVFTAGVKDFFREIMFTVADNLEGMG